MINFLVLKHIGDDNLPITYNMINFLVLKHIRDDNLPITYIMINFLVLNTSEMTIYPYHSLSKYFPQKQHKNVNVEIIHYLLDIKSYDKEKAFEESF